MKVLLTGASGFVGSHILDALGAHNVDVTLLLRPSSSRSFIQAHLPRVQVVTGFMDEPEALDKALAGVTHVVHCAGATRALGTAGFFEANQTGTRHLVEAVNRRGKQVLRFLHISSLAAMGPSAPGHPVREEDTPKPVTVYGQSKLAGEREVTSHCRAPWTILRPPAVYGPRDGEFLRLFKAAKARLGLRLLGGPEALSMVYVTDLAGVVREMLSHPKAGGTWHVASPETVTATQLAAEVAAQMRVRTWTVPLPVALLWPVCLAQEGWSRLTRRASVLSLQKYPELRAPGWECDASRLSKELGLGCGTRLPDGLGQTLAWYRKEGWL